MQNSHDVSQRDQGTSPLRHRLLLGAAWLGLAVFGIPHVWQVFWFVFLLCRQLLFFGFLSVVWGLLVLGLHKLTSVSSAAGGNGFDGSALIEKVALPVMLTSMWPLTVFTSDIAYNKPPGIQDDAVVHVGVSLALTLGVVVGLRVVERWSPAAIRPFCVGAGLLQLGVVAASYVVEHPGLLRVLTDDLLPHTALVFVPLGFALFDRAATR